MRRQRTPIDKFTDAAAVPLVIGGLTLAAFDIGRRLFRRSQVFCPDRNPVKSWDPADYGIPPEAVEEQWFESSDGELLYGWYCRAPKPVASGVFCHGNTGNLTITADVIPHLLDSGFNVLFFDYRGFGRSTGRPSFNGVIADGVAAARHHDKIRPKHLPSILYGFSLGGAIAAQVIRRHPFDGLILQSTFTSLPDMARVTWPNLPLHYFTGNLFNTLGVLRGLKVPLLLMHGAADEVAPVWMAHRLYDACPSDKMIHIVDGALHKDLYVRDPDALVWAIHQFSSSLPRNHRAHVVEPEPVFDQLIDAALRKLRRALRRRRLTPQTL